MGTIETEPCHILSQENGREINHSEGKSNQLFSLVRTVIRFFVRELSWAHNTQTPVLYAWNDVSNTAAGALSPGFLGDGKCISDWIPICAITASITYIETDKTLHFSYCSSWWSTIMGPIHWEFHHSAPQLIHSFKLICRVYSPGCYSVGFLSEFPMCLSGMNNNSSKCIYKARDKATLQI